MDTLLSKKLTRGNERKNSIKTIHNFRLLYNLFSFNHFLMRQYFGVKQNIGFLSVVCSSIFWMMILFISCDSGSNPVDQLPEKPMIAKVDTKTSNDIPDNWWNQRVFYEIFVRSFYDSDGDGIGDIQGTIQKLDYLNDGNPNTFHDLGITGIWLMPTFPSPSYHGYDVTNYREINPQYGTIDDFKELLAEAHQRGIKIIIDFVGNHSSDQHPWFQNSVSKGNKRDWYLWRDTKPNFNGPWGQNVWHSRNNSYYYGVFWHGMPDLNYNNPAVTQEIKEIVRFWVEDIGVDGFRIDAVKHWIEEGSLQENSNTTLNWWKDFYQFQKALDSELMTVGEVWSDTNSIIPYTEERLDYCFEFDLAGAIINGVNRENALTIQSKIRSVSKAYVAGQYGVFLSNHDQNRSFETFNKNILKAKMAASILLTIQGVPYVYYGEEIGMLGVKPDEDIRKPMQWSSEANGGFTIGVPWRQLNSDYTAKNVSVQLDDHRSLLKHYQKLISLRNRHSALSIGDYRELKSQDRGVLAFIRKDEVSNQTFLVVHNISTRKKTAITLTDETAFLAQGTYRTSDKLSNNENLIIVIDEIGSGNLAVSQIKMNDLDLGPYASLITEIK